MLSLGVIANSRKPLPLMVCKQQKTLRDLKFPIQSQRCGENVLVIFTKGFEGLGMEQDLYFIPYTEKDLDPSLSQLILKSVRCGYICLKLVVDYEICPHHKTSQFIVCGVEVGISLSYMNFAIEKHISFKELNSFLYSCVLTPKTVYKSSTKSLGVLVANTRRQFEMMDTHVFHYNPNQPLVVITPQWETPVRRTKFIINHLPLLKASDDELPHDDDTSSSSSSLALMSGCTYKLVHFERIIIPTFHDIFENLKILFALALEIMNESAITVCNTMTTRKRTRAIASQFHALIVTPERWMRYWSEYFYKELGYARKQVTIVSSLDDLRRPSYNFTTTGTSVHYNGGIYFIGTPHMLSWNVMLQNYNSRVYLGFIFTRRNVKPCETTQARLLLLETKSLTILFISNYTRIDNAIQ